MAGKGVGLSVFECDHIEKRHGIDGLVTLVATIRQEKIDDYRQDKVDLAEAFYAASAGITSKKGHQYFEKWRKAIKPETEADKESKKSQLSVFEMRKLKNGIKSR